jgi:signal transduction histidine kinase
MSSRAIAPRGFELSLAETTPERSVDPDPAGPADVAALRVAQPPAAGIVHDLGNLIQVASSAVSLMARDAGVAGTPALEPVLAGARMALQRAGALVREALVRASDEHCAPEISNVGTCLGEVETLVRSVWEPGLRLQVQAGIDLPVVNCDRLGLQNAILNLVFNARDAMPDGGLIRIDAATVVRGADTLVELLVRDNGIGMTPETVRRAFDPFFTTKGKGLGGVGLPMVKHFAEQNGGSVEIESALGSGTTVILRLPASRRPLWPRA